MADDKTESYHIPEQCTECGGDYKIKRFDGFECEDCGHIAELSHPDGDGLADHGVDSGYASIPHTE